MAVAVQETGCQQLADRTNYRIALGGILGVGSEDMGELALGEAGRVLGEDEDEGGPLD